MFSQSAVGAQSVKISWGSRGHGLRASRKNFR
jgi:hypothetical protein